MGYKAGVIPKKAKIEWVDYEAAKSTSKN